MLDSIVIPKENRIHLAFQDGKLKSTGPKDLEFSRPGDVDQVFQNIKNSNKKSITFYFHGGLVNSATDQLLHKPGFPYNPENQILLDTIKENSYPVFVIWETGVIECLKALYTNFAADPYNYISYLLKEASRSVLFEKITKYLLNFVTGQAQRLNLGITEPVSLAFLESAGLSEKLFRQLETFDPDLVEYRAPTEDEQKSWIHALANDTELSQRLAEIAIQNTAGIGLTGSPTALTDRDFLSDETLKVIVAGAVPDAGITGVSALLFQEFYGRVIKAGIAIIRRFATRRHHGYYPTIAEEVFRFFLIGDFAGSLWDQIKENARKAYQPNASSTSEPYGGRYIVEKLKKYLIANPDTRVNLIGHSAGSIHISHFLATSAEVFGTELPGFRFQNVILLAPGATFELYADKVVPQASRIENFRIFTMLNDYEKADPMFSPIYPTSILFFVSAVAERDANGDKPILGLARHLDRQLFQEIKLTDPNVDRVQQFIQAYNQNNTLSPIIYSKTGDAAPQGQRSDAVHHGDFDNDRLTLESIKFYLG